MHNGKPYKPIFLKTYMTNTIDNACEHATPQEDKSYICENGNICPYEADRSRCEIAPIGLHIIPSLLVGGKYSPKKNGRVPYSVASEFAANNYD